MLEHALAENEPGPLGDSARRLARDPILWVVTFANPGIVLGILWNMVNKPGVGQAIAAVVVGYVSVALPFTRSRTLEAPAVANPAA
jgi:hypothetical protein